MITQQKHLTFCAKEFPLSTLINLIEIGRGGCFLLLVLRMFIVAKMSDFCAELTQIPEKLRAFFAK